MPWTRQIRSRIRRFGLDTEPPTLPGVFLPRGAYTPGLPRTVAVARTYDVMDVALRCGAQLLARGTAAVDVESAVHAAATTLGLRDVEVDITFNALSITAVEEGWPVAASRVVRQGAPDYQRLTLVHRLVTDVVSGSADLEEATARLDLIETEPRAYGPGVVLLANGVLAGAVAGSLGAGWVVAISALVTGVLIVWASNRLAAPRIPAFFLAALGGALAVGAAAILTSADVPARPSLVVAASIIVLLPGVALVGAVRDALVGFPLTAVGRAVDGLVVVGGIVTGVLVGLSVSSALALQLQIIPADEVTPTPLAVRVVAGAVAAGAAAVLAQAPRSLVGAALLVGGVSYAAATLFGEVIDNRTLAAAAAAVIVGLVAGLAAQRGRTLALVLVVPGLIPLLPGLTIYRGTLLLTAGETVSGLVALLEAGALMGALAGGALLGEIFVGRRRT